MTTTADLIEVAYGADVLRFDPLEHTYHLNDQLLLGTTHYIKAAGYDRGYFGDGSAAWKGRHVHTATHYHDLDDLDMDSLDPALKGYVEAWAAFKAESQFVPDLTWRERPCFHPIYRYAGTADAIGQTPLGPTVVEIKTGQPVRWHHLQAGGAYQPMIAAHRPEYARAAVLLVYLAEDGRYHVERVKDAKLPMLFASIVAVVNGRHLYGVSNGHRP